MIVISAALVVVATILLVIGLVDSSLTFIYASIGVSLAAFAFLIVGILQRRKEELPGADLPVAEPSEGVTTLPAVALTKGSAEAAPAADGLTGTVLVVEGRPRYHVEGCRYLTGKDADAVDVAAARADGFTACGVCKPDESLAAAAAPAAEVAAEEPATEEAAPARVAKAPARTTLAKPPAKAAEPAEAADAAEPAVAAEPAAPAKAAKAPAKKAPTKALTSAAATRAAKAPAKAPAAKAPAKAAAAKAAPAKKAPAKAAPAKAAAAKAAPAKRGGVVVIPDRDKFHTPDCRYVRGAEGTEELTKAAATKQGYVPCGVCNP